MPVVINGDTGITQAGEFDSDSSFGFKNRLINGGMGIWQRGTSSSTIGAYVADRWAINTGTSVTATRSTDVPSGFQYSLSLSGTNFPQTYQRIESLNCVDLPGQTITVSFWAKQTSGAAVNSLGLGLAAPNTADNYAAATTIGTNQVFTGSTSWTQYTATYTNVNALVANGLQVLIFANTSGAATFLVTGVQCEKSSTATSFDFRSYGTEFGLCERYCQTIVSPSAGFMILPAVGGITASNNARLVLPYSEMRAPPTATFASAGSFLIQEASGTVNRNVTAVGNISTPGVNSMGIDFTISGASTGQPAWVYANGVSGLLITLSAEL